MATKQAPVTPRQTKQPAHSCIDSKAEVLVPMDLSFMDATELLDLEDSEPRTALKKSSQKKDDKEDRYVTRSVRLCNNMLQDIKGLMDFFEKKIDDPSSLAWVDLSFNQLATIEATLCDLPNLQFLYYHSNAIQDLKEVDKLAGMPKLRKLTLHGNEIDKNKNYKCYILSRVKGLTHLDFSKVTKADIATVSTWESSAANKKKPRRKRGDDR